MFIYKITNTLNNMSYIGQTKRFKQRVATHKSYLKKNKHPNKELQVSWCRDGEENFSFEILDECPFDISADNLERFWIKFHKSNYKEHGFNIESGGRWKKEVSAETRARLSATGKINPSRGMLGKKHSIETRWRMRKPKHSESFKIKMSKKASLKTGEKNPFFGKVHTEEFKKRMSNLKKKEVLCVETGVVYSSAEEASVAMGISKSSVAHCCSGRVKSARGYRFTYKKGLG